VPFLHQFAPSFRPRATLKPIAFGESNCRFISRIAALLHQQLRRVLLHIVDRLAAWPLLAHRWRVVNQDGQDVCRARREQTAAQGVVSLTRRGVSACEVTVTDELRHVRDWASDQIRAGRAQGSSWYQYVKLIEATDAILHDVQIVANSRAAARQHFEGEGRGQKLRAIRGGRRH